MNTMLEETSQTNDRFRWAALMLLATLLGLAWISYSREPVVDWRQWAGLAEGPIAGYRAPDFVLPTLEGRELTLSDFQGEPVILNFWASWCVPCRAEMPLLERTAIQYRGRVTILGVNNGESRQVVQEFNRQLNLTFPLLIDNNYLVGDQYYVTALPTTFFIDRNGLIREVFTGILNEAILQNRLESLLQP
ncbi:MAG: TlpA family protein disulfide reductase [Anaerolineae bacterium]|nr:TlpA family protein disulfide reductase [Anaerolineae bacterium]